MRCVRACERYYSSIWLLTRFSTVFASPVIIINSSGEKWRQKQKQQQMNRQCNGAARTKKLLFCDIQLLIMPGFRYYLPSFSSFPLFFLQSTLCVLSPSTSLLLLWFSLQMYEEMKRQTDVHQSYTLAGYGSGRGDNTNACWRTIKVERR